MRRLLRTLNLVFGASGLALVPSACAHAQIFGYRSGAMDFAPVDAAALGDTLRASIGLFAGSNEYVGAAGIGLAGGALRGYVGGLSAYRGYRGLLAAGYARTLAARTLAGPIHGTIGGELAGGYRHLEYAPHDAGGLHLTAPIGVSLGDPSGASLGFYAAPYAESGLLRQFDSVPGCTTGRCYALGGVVLQNAAGLGAGLRLSFGRLAAELRIFDVIRRGGAFYYGDGGSIGFTYRLAR